MAAFLDVRRFWDCFLSHQARRATLLTIASISLFLVLPGCAGQGNVRQESVRIVQAGDMADVHYLCKLKTGEVVASTDALPKDLPRSPLFMPGAKGPITVTAGAPFPELAGGKEMAIENEIKYRLASNVVGMKVRENYAVELTADDISSRTEQNYVLKLARIRKRPLEMRIPADEYAKRAGKSAEVGQPFNFDPAIPGKVEAVTDKDVVIRFSAKPGDVVKTLFGPGHIRQTDSGFEIVIDAKVGALVRTGKLVGRITAVNDETITVDYRNPFGREPLLCDVKVDKLEMDKMRAVEKVAGNEEKYE